MMKNQFLLKISHVLKKAFKTKSPDELIATGNKSELSKTLNVMDLIVIGIGAVIGTGIFTIVGIAAQGGPEGVGAGPALVVSMVIAAVACVCGTCPKSMTKKIESRKIIFFMLLFLILKCFPIF